jgi:PPOX class probable F420-dependent enzyme
VTAHAQTDVAPPIPESHRDILEKKGFAHIATTGPQGEPQSSPVWYGWDGAHLKFSNTKGRQKYRNLLRNPHVSASITDPDDPYRYVEIRGVAEIEDDPDRAFIDEMSRKYMGRDYPWNRPGEERVVVKIRPEHATTQG